MNINKRFGLWIILLLGATSINCKQAEPVVGIDFSHASFNEAISEAGKTNKLIFVDAYATWCGPCKYMSKKVFTDDAVGQLYNEKFISLKIDMEKGEGIQLSKKFGIRAYPTLIIFNSDGEEIARQVGALDANQLISFGKKAVSSGS